MRISDCSSDVCSSDLVLAWRDGPLAPGPAVIVDLDGTLSDASGRQHFLDRRPKDWNGFFRAVGQDPVVAHVVRLVELLDEELLVVQLGRASLWERVC